MRSHAACGLKGRDSHSPLSAPQRLSGLPVCSFKVYPINRAKSSTLTSLNDFTDFSA